MELAVLVVDPLGNRDNPLAIFPAANRRTDVRHGRHVLLMEFEVFAIRHARPARETVKGRDNPLALLVEQQDAVQFFQRLHASGESFLQAWPERRTETVHLNPVHQTGQHQVGLHERVFGLLRHGPRQVRRRHLGLVKVVAPGLFQLQVKQTAQAQAHCGDK
ncbi:hypothetical protein D3C86_1322830 [compost metagenome]